MNEPFIALWHFSNKYYLGILFDKGMYFSILTIYWQIFHVLEKLNPKLKFFIAGEIR